MTDHTPTNAIILVCDRLNPSFLGPYGNTWVDTPTLNEIAAGSLLFETCVADSIDLTRAYRSLWLGEHIASAPQSSVSIIEQLSRRNIATSLVTDDNTICDHKLGESFDQHVLYECDLPSRCAPSLDETRFAKLMAHAVSVAESMKPPFVLWVHASAMNSTWDAPYPFREFMADEEDPRPPRFVEPPSEILGQEPDPDYLLGLSQAYAAEVYALDRNLSLVWDWIRSSKDVALGVTSTRGYPLGEHGIVGAAEECMFHESLYLPWMLHNPLDDTQIFRSQTIIQPATMWHALAEMFGIEHNLGMPLNELAVTSDVRQAISIGQQSHVIRNDEWTLQISADSDDERVGRLYAKPDDRWESNDVAGLCPRVVEALSAELAEYLKAASV